MCCAVYCTGTLYSSRRIPPPAAALPARTAAPTLVAAWIEPHTPGLRFVAQSRARTCTTSTSTAVPTASELY